MNRQVMREDLLTRRTQIRSVFKSSLVPGYTLHVTAFRLPRPILIAAYCVALCLNGLTQDLSTGLNAWQNTAVKQAKIFLSLMKPTTSEHEAIYKMLPDAWAERLSSPDTPSPQEEKIRTAAGNSISPNLVSLWLALPELTHVFAKEDDTYVISQERIDALKTTVRNLLALKGEHSLIFSVSPDPNNLGVLYTSYMRNTAPLLSVGVSQSYTFEDSPCDFKFYFFIRLDTGHVYLMGNTQLEQAFLGLDRELELAWTAHQEKCQKNFYAKHIRDTYEVPKPIAIKIALSEDTRVGLIQGTLRLGPRAHLRFEERGDQLVFQTQDRRITWEFIKALGHFVEGLSPGQEPVIGVSKTHIYVLMEGGKAPSQLYYGDFPPKKSSHGPLTLKKADITSTTSEYAGVENTLRTGIGTFVYDWVEGAFTRNGVLLNGLY